MKVFYTYFTPGLGKMGIPCYNKNFVFLIKYFNAKHYSLTDTRFVSQ